MGSTVLNVFNFWFSNPTFRIIRILKAIRIFSVTMLWIGKCVIVNVRINNVGKSELC